MTTIAMVTYDRMTALDLLGPYEVLGQWPDPTVTVTTVGTSPGPVRCDNGVRIVCERHIDDLPAPDVIVVPGATDVSAGVGDRALIDWLAADAPTAAQVMSVCTGALLLAEAGLLAGRRATTHWAYRDRLAATGVDVVTDRVVDEGPVMTTAGVSAGIDGALLLAARLWGEDAARMLQLAIEYDPQPPFDSGNAATADPALVGLLRAALASRATHTGAVDGAPPMPS